MSENDSTTPPQTMIIIYVAHQKQSTAFYQSVLGKKPLLDVPGMTEFELSNGLLLGIMPEENIARLLGDTVPHPGSGSGIPRSELYLPVQDPESSYKMLIQNGGKGISPPEKRTWGHIVAYGIDPDGHVLAFAKI